MRRALVPLLSREEGVAQAPSPPFQDGALGALSLHPQRGSKAEKGSAEALR